jgi:stage V sporulation protein D (sporulation-specific penicillin-binding protein)
MVNTAKKKPDELRANRIILQRITFLLVLFGIGLFIPLFMKLYQIQIIEHDFYEQKAISQQTRGTAVSASRGTIYDRNYKTLAISASVETVYIAPVYIKNDAEAEKMARGLADILGLDYESVLAKTKNRSSYYQMIQRKIEQDVADEIRLLKSENNFKAIQIEPDTKRYYSFSKFASQVIGFVGVDNEGLEGLEVYYDKTLTGVAGKIVTAKNAAGTSMPFKFEKYYDAQDGRSIVLTIDETIQHIIEKNLEQAVIDNGVEKQGGAIVMDVKTGEILAMATTEGSDLNSPRMLNDSAMKQLEGLEGEAYTKKLTELQLAQWRNKMVADTYQPGSIFKLITCSMALEEGVIDLHSTFTCTGSMMVKGWNKPISCWKKAGHGTQELTRALQNSCNPAFMTIGLKVGKETFYNYIRAFGFGQYTGVDLPGEEAGILHDKSVFLDEKSDASLAVSAFGQTFTVTPIQMITAVSAVVNGGYLMEPHIVKEIVDSNGTVIQSVEPKVVRQVISEKTSETMIYLMEQVVADGSGRNAQVQGYSIGGKTATSEKIGEANSEGKYVVSFIAVAPANDPQIAMLVLLDTPGDFIPQNQRSGGYLAAPLAGRILSEILPYLGYEPEFTGDEMFGSSVTVPKLTELSRDDAVATLAKKDMKYKVVGDGNVVTGQLPAAGAKITTSSEVILYMGSEAPSDYVKVPNVVGKSPEKANELLTNAGLFLRPTGATSAQTSTITAAVQSEAEGTEAPRGTIIEVEFRDTAVGDFAY